MQKMGGQHKDRGRTGHHAGAAAEDIVARHYEARSMPVAARRWRGTGGEIDLICRDGDDLVFVEVKKSVSFDRAALGLSARQIERIVATASEFAAAEPRGELTPMRFDLALVDGSGRLRLVENALAHL